jgi:ABC-type polysaccharide/polyol phosphate transport system ATPase subunit
MSDVALRMEHVHKKFRKGEIFDSLRDLIPALTGRMFRQQELSASDRREFWALQDVSFEVKHGEAFGIIGSNGAGKSTALKILSRIMKPTKGRMVLNGRLSALIEVGAGFHQDLTGRENIFLYGTILGMTKREIESKLDQIVAFAGLEEFIDTPIKHYSSGMYARLGFSVAAHVDPEVERMRTVINDGATVLFVSHNLKAVTELCQRAMLLEHGKVVSIGPTDSVVRCYLREALKPSGAEPDKAVYLSQVTIRDRAGEQATFESGQTAWVDIEVTARESVERLAIVLWLTDENQYDIFNTSTQRLNHPPFSLRAGESYRCTFELSLNIAHGTFYVCASIYRYDVQKLYDRKAPASALFVGSTAAVRGAVNCFPRLVEAGTVTATSPSECGV